MAADIGTMVGQAAEFTRRLNAIKKTAQANFGWYPYDSLANVAWFDALLRGPRRRLLELAGSEPVIDLGCADGDLSFFLESLGCRVHACDYAPTGYNWMQGVRMIKEKLGSSVEIIDADLDRVGVPGSERYGLACMLGLLYHLKNPFLVLETLASRARYLLLSTRIARYTPGRGINYETAPMAYLVDDDELNQDDSNYWIFSEAGLRRILSRSGWKVVDFLRVGNPSSDPRSPEGDQRAYCLARSRSVEPVTTADLCEGWHGLEPAQWRWTEGRFAAVFRDYDELRGRRLRLRFTLLEDWVKRLGALRLEAGVNGIELPSRDYPEAGRYLYEAELPGQIDAGDGVRVEFRLNQTMEADPPDRRRLGVVVSHLGLD